MWYINGYYLTFLPESSLAPSSSPALSLQPVVFLSHVLPASAQQFSWHVPAPLLSSSALALCADAPPPPVKQKATNYSPLYKNRLQKKESGSSHLT